MVPLQKELKYFILFLSLSLIFVYFAATWMDESLSAPVLFSDIACMHSALIGLTLDGALYHWPWDATRYA